MIPYRIYRQYLAYSVASLLNNTFIAEEGTASDAISGRIITESGSLLMV